MNYGLLAGIFTEGLLSFFSPCVLPLLPLYISYLAGSHEDKEKQKNAFLRMLFFVAGISLTFFILAFSLQSLKGYLDKYNILISIIGGTLLVISALHQLGIIHIDFMDKEFRLKVDLHLDSMSCLKAFLMGFIFSFGWTPCIGPLLANAILLAAQESNGYLYILAYAAGLIIPFLLTGIFTDRILNYFNTKRQILKWTSKIAGMIILCFGIYMIHNGSSAIFRLQDLSAKETISEETDIETYLIEYEFEDIDGNPIHLKDYQGNYLLLNFTTTWCTYCEIELPQLTSFSENEDVDVLLVMSPVNEYTPDAIGKYIAENHLKLKVLIDKEGILFYYCNISGYPTTYVLDPDSHFLVYTAGMLDYDGFANMLDYAKNMNQ